MAYKEGYKGYRRKRLTKTATKKRTKSLLKRAQKRENENQVACKEGHKKNKRQLTKKNFCELNGGKNSQ